MDILIEAVPAYGEEIDFKISEPPKFGMLTEGEKTIASSKIFHYKNFSLPKCDFDSFQFRIKSPRHAWSTYTAQIHIKDPPGTISMSPDSMDFGKVPLGVTAQKTLVLSNNFGASVSGTLLVTAPWKIVEDPSFRLEEGKSCSYTINFSPTDVTATNGLLKSAPELDNFPILPLKGSGMAPFSLDSLSKTVSSEEPVARYQVTNVSIIPICVTWAGDPTLDFSPSQTIGPGETAMMWISTARIQMPVEGRKTLKPILVEDHFSQSVELTILGSKGNVSIEALGGGEMLAAKIGHPIFLESILRNTSQSSRLVELYLLNFPGDKAPLLQILTLNPGQVIPLSQSWIPKSEGLCTPTLLVSESGKSLCCASWKVIVSGLNSAPSLPRFVNQVDALSASSSPIPENSFRKASDHEKELIVVPLPPTFKDGFLRRSLVFRWRYLGGENTDFTIREHESVNSLMNRTGENTDQWKRIASVSHSSMIAPGIWEAVLPMPWPGTHEYLITANVSGDRIAAPIQIGITSGMFIWPSLRFILVVAVLLLLVRVIRSRI